MNVAGAGDLILDPGQTGTMLVGDSRHAGFTGSITVRSGKVDLPEGLRHGQRIVLAGNGTGLQVEGDLSVPVTTAAGATGTSLTRGRSLADDPAQPDRRHERVCRELHGRPRTRDPALVPLRARRARDDPRQRDPRAAVGPELAGSPARPRHRPAAPRQPHAIRHHHRPLHRSRRRRHPRRRQRGRAVGGERRHRRGGHSDRLLPYAPVPERTRDRAGHSQRRRHPPCGSLGLRRHVANRGRPGHEPHRSGAAHRDPDPLRP